MQSVSVVAIHIIQCCALTLSSSGIYNDPQKRRGIGKTFDWLAIYSGRQQKRKLISGYWLQVGLKVDLVMIGQIMGQEWGQKGDKNSTKTGKTAGKNVLNVAKYLSFYHCYLILCDVNSLWIRFVHNDLFGSINR